MRKGPLPPVRWLLVLVFLVLFVFLSPCRAAQAQSDPEDALAQGILDRAQSELSRVRLLVQEGTLPRVRLAEAEEHLADARDEVTLARTLYGQTHLQDMTAQQAAEMTESAERRVQRQQKIVEDRRPLVDGGILARADFEAFEQELLARQRVLELVRHRVKLLDELKQMAEAERLQETASRTAARSLMMRYEGAGVFRVPADLTTISKEFQRKFHRPLQVSAQGATAVHRSMGLDHRGRVDVSLNPDTPEGLWLRQLLERLRIPYLAFRGAIAGAATAPHIHIGLGSARLAIAAH
jgi:hypothetical protein